MDKKEYKNMSNSEINIKLKSLEDEYENTKLKVLKLVEEMKKLDELYLEGKKELSNRKKGIF